MDALEAFDDHRFDSQQERALGRPVAGGAGAVFLAAEDHQRHTLGLVAHGRVVDRHLVAGRQVLRHAAFDIVQHLVPDADVGEGAAHHDFMVAAAGAVAVEILLLHLVLTEVLAGRGRLADIAGRADVVGGDAIAQLCQHARAGDVADRGRLHGDAIEVRGVLHVGGTVVPAVGGGAGFDLDVLPLLGTFADLAVALQELVARQAGSDDVGDFLVGRPDVTQVDRLAVVADAQRFGGDVHRHLAQQRVGDYQRRGGQIIRAHVGVDPALEVAVAGNHGGPDQAIVLDRVHDGVVQRAGVADAGRAAVADGVKADGVQVGGQAGFIQVLCHHLRTGRQRGFHPGLRPQPLGMRLARHQPGGDEDRRVGRVGAGCDRGDHDVAVGQLVILALDLDGHVGFVRRDAQALGEVGLEAGGDVLQRHPVLRALRAGHARLDRGQIQFQRVGEHRVGLAGLAEHSLGLQVGFHQRDAVGVAAGQAQVIQRHLVHREEAAGRAVFRRHIADRGAIRQAQIVQAGAVEFHEFAHHALAAEHLRDRQHDVGGGDAFLGFAGQAEADHVRDQHGDWLPEHGGLGLDAADAPAEDAEAVDHRGVAIGAVKRVGVSEGGAAVSGRPHALPQVFQVHLMADAGARRDHAEIVERVLAPAQELVAFFIALELDIDVLLQGVGGAEDVGLHGMVDHQIDRHQRVHLVGIAAQPGQPVAHRGQIDHRRHTRKVLQQDARGLERHFLGGAALREPADDGLRVGGGVAAPILEPQGVFQQDFQADRQAGEVAQGLRRLGQGVVVVGLALDREGAACLESVVPDRCHVPGSVCWMLYRSGL